MGEKPQTNSIATTRYAGHYVATYIFFISGSSWSSLEISTEKSIIKLVMLELVRSNVTLHSNVHVFVLDFGYFFVQFLIVFN